MIPNHRVRIVINNEAFIDYPVKEDFDFLEFCQRAKMQGAVLLNEVFVPYGQIQAIFFFSDTAKNIKAQGMGVTLQ